MPMWKVCFAEDALEDVVLSSICIGSAIGAARRVNKWHQFHLLEVEIFQFPVDAQTCVRGTCLPAAGASNQCRERPCS